MILSVYQLGGEQSEVVIDGNNLMFRDPYTQTITTIEGLKINKGGVIKEHPDLEDDSEWRKKAIERLKEHLKKMESELIKLDYVKKELTKFGWKPLYFQKVGFRPQKFKD